MWASRCLPLLRSPFPHNSHVMSRLTTSTLPSPINYSKLGFCRFCTCFTVYSSFCDLYVVLSFLDHRKKVTPRECHLAFNIIGMMGPLAVVLLSSILLRSAIADFAVLEPGLIANSSTVTLSTACVNALQSSVACDQYLQDNAYIDAYGPLNASLLDTFCTTGCSSSLISYRKNVVSACAKDPQPYSGIPAQYFVDVIWAQYNFICLKDPGTGQYCNSMCPDSDSHIHQSWPHCN